MPVTFGRSVEDSRPLSHGFACTKDSILVDLAYIRTKKEALSELAK